MIIIQRHKGSIHLVIGFFQCTGAILRQSGITVGQKDDDLFTVIVLNLRCRQQILCLCQTQCNIRKTALVVFDRSHFIFRSCQRCLIADIHDLTAAEQFMGKDNIANAAAVVQQITKQPIGIQRYFIGVRLNHRTAGIQYKHDIQIHLSVIRRCFLCCGRLTALRDRRITAFGMNAYQQTAHNQQKHRQPCSRFSSCIFQHHRDPLVFGSF